MKTFFTTFLLIPFFVIAQTPCENGFAGSFPCEGYDLLSQIPLNTFNSVKANDSWGWTDATTGKEYGLLCLNEGTAFIDISDPLDPIYLGFLPGESNQHTTWRDVKTYNDYALIVSEDSGHGMQIFDLTKLRDVANPPVTFTKDAYYDDFGSCHNIVINADTGYAYAVGSDTFGGGPHFINIQDPLNPVGEGGFTSEGYTHDAQVLVYNGPDSDHQGKEILFGANETHVAIVDVTDKNNPNTIATMDYTNVNYTHQGWLTEDLRYYFLGDETDEINTGINSRTIVFDLNDLDNPQFHLEYFGPTTATDHNGYVKGDYFYLANNAAGLRVVDISDIGNMNMSEIGYFDSYPANDASGFNGSWSIYPYFESGNIVISDRAEGFLVVRPSTLLNADSFELNPFKLVPNPVNDILTIHGNQPLQEIALFDITGKSLMRKQVNGQMEVSINLSSLSSGMYLLSVNGSSAQIISKN